VSSFVIHLLTVGCLYATMALGLNLQAGYAGLVNFGFIAFSGLGAYAAGIASQLGWPLPSALTLALAAAGALAIVVARLGRQLSADYWGIATLAIAEILRTIALNESWLTGGAQGIGGIAPLFPGLRAPWAELAFLAVTAGCLALTYATYRRLTASRFGRALKVMREEPALAVCFGYDPLALKTRACIAGALPAALAGAKGDDDGKTGALIDSPGFQEFGLHHLTEGRLERAFPEFRPLLPNCRFYNCHHLHEPGCAILEAVEDGRIRRERHALYAQLVHEASQVVR